MEQLNIHNVTYTVEIPQRKNSLPYLLLLHGFMGDRRVFAHLVDELCEMCNPVAIDLLGHGKTDKPQNPSRYQEDRQVQDLHELIEQLAIFPLFLHGYSMGGRLALKTALADPQKFTGLILESTTCGITGKKERGRRRTADEQRALEIENDFEGFLSRWEALNLFQSPVASAVQEKRSRRYRSVHLDQHPEAMAASLRGFGTGSMTPVCERSANDPFRNPVLIMAGAGDEKYKTIARSLSGLFPDVRISYPEAGHRVHLDNPAKFLQELNHHIKTTLSL